VSNANGLEKICFAFIGGFLVIITKGFVWYCYWAWFICTTVNVPQITLAQASGFALITIFLKTKQKTENETTVKQLAETFRQIIGECGIMLLFGKLITIFL